MIRFRSIISRIVAFHVVAIAVTSVLMPLALYYLLNEAANSLHRDALRSQAATIAGFLRPQPDGSVTLDIPSEIQPLYRFFTALQNVTGPIITGLLVCQYSNC